MTPMWYLDTRLGNTEYDHCTLPDMVLNGVYGGFSIGATALTGEKIEGQQP